MNTKLLIPLILVLSLGCKIKMDDNKEEDEALELIDQIQGVWTACMTFELDEVTTHDLKATLESDGNKFTTTQEIYTSANGSCTGNIIVVSESEATISFPSVSVDVSGAVAINSKITSASFTLESDESTFFNNVVPPCVGIDPEDLVIGQSYDLSNSACGFLPGETEYGIIKYDPEAETIRMGEEDETHDGTTSSKRYVVLGDLVLEKE